ncbi:MAG TPA: RHS repeat-associated core domain-containing protein, partial [Saprospiraceae bacterium]|nr:RHS repeat-associated core domain-containing protein [Saprospiraceae bacterium]
MSESSTVDYYEPEIVQASDYYAFGLEMPGRKYNNPLFSGTNEYRYGFNGKELDKSGEFGSLTHYDYGFRIYNPSIGKFLSVDPLTKSYPMLTPYQFASNTPIAAVDLDGLERAIVINKFSKGKMTETIISTISDGENEVNLNASGNNLSKLSYQDILEINENEDGSMTSFNVRQDFTANEKLIIDAGVDRFRNLKVGDGLYSNDGFEFPGSIAKSDNY